MKFGPTPPKKVPKQDAMKMLRMAERHQRASWAHNSWAERAKRSVDFFEGRHYTADQIAELVRQGRPHFKFNVIAPLVRLILGYQGNNKTDITFQQGQDTLSSEMTAEALSRLEKSIAQGCDLEYVDCEVFLAGLLTGRGFYDTRLDWKHNDLGQIKTKARDEFQTKIDPDADTYDLNESASYICTEKWVSVDEIECAFGKKIASLIRPFTSGSTPLAPLSSFVVNNEIIPVRTFGETDGNGSAWWDQFYDLSGSFVDTYRKTIRLVETQYKVYEPKNVIIDLETGDTKVLPDEWDEERINKALLYCEAMNNPCYVEERNVERIHWTTFAGDLILYDQPSMYDGFTITGFFPYFRRGMTKGMVEDMIDPQLEKNKRRNAEIEIVGRTANGGWTYHEKSLDPIQERNLKKFGSRPGVTIKWKGETHMEPKVIQPSNSPMKHERLENQADEDIRTISGVNESALGEIDRVQSGRAIEARQRQAVLSVQTYSDNFKRSKKLLGHRHLDIIQNHYTEARMFRVMGEDSKFTSDWINQKIVNPAGGPDSIRNDVTIGQYVAICDTASISPTFMQAQFEEAMMLLEKLGPAGAQLMPAVIDLIIGMSSMPRKQEWIERINAALGKPTAPQPGVPPGAGGPPALPPPGGGGAPMPANVVPFNAATMPR
jgi:hypothetical protein